VRDGVTGIMVPPDDPAAMADALAELLRDPQRARRLGSAARDWIERNFDGEANGERRARRFARALGIERVLYVSADRGVPVRGHKGASVHVRSVVGALAQAGVETTILTAREGPQDGPVAGAPLVEARSDRACGALVSWIARATRGGEPLERALLRLLDNLWLHAAGLRLAKRWRPDLIYERYALTAVAGAWLARHLRVPFVLEVNSPLVDEERAFRALRLGGLGRWTEGWLLQRADRVVVVSWALHAYALRRGVRHERILVLPNAVDPAQFGTGRDGATTRKRLGLDGDFVIGFCGSLKPWHGVHRLIEAAALAAPAVPDLRLLIVGDGPARADLQGRARALGVLDRVHFTGAVSHAEVPDYLAACDLLCAPYEPAADFYFSPLKLAEYIAVGRPIVVSAAGEIPWSVEGVPGVTLVPPGDAESLSRAIVRQAGSRSRTVAAHPAGGARRWTWTDVVSRILAAGEDVRRAQWSWDAPQPAATGVVLETFPALTDPAAVDQLLAIQRSAPRLVVFALEQSKEHLPPRRLEELRTPVRIIWGVAGAGLKRIFACHMKCLLQHPLAYLAVAARAARDARRGGLERFAAAPFVAETARRHGVERLIGVEGAGVRALAAAAARLAGIPAGPAVLPLIQPGPERLEEAA